MRVLVVCALVLSLGGCRKTVTYHRQAFPGFSLEVPSDVNYTGDPIAQYRAGQIEWQNGLRFVVVSWQAGAIATTEELPAIAKAIAAAIPNGMKMTNGAARSQKVGGNEATWLDAKIEGVDMTFVDITCGKRSVLIAIGSGSSFADMRNRIVDSFQCTPIAAEDTALVTSAPIGVDDPTALTGWYSMPIPDAFAMSNGELVAVFTQVPMSTLDGTTLDKVLPTLFGAFGSGWTPTSTEKRKVGSLEREFHLGQMSIDGEGSPAVVSVWPCGTRGDMVMGLVISVAGKEVSGGIDFLTKTRCAKRDDPALPLDPPPAAIKEALEQQK